jgi:DUF4097 and DUF4098 domain-containing protein YvlB
MKNYTYASLLTLLLLASTTWATAQNVLVNTTKKYPNISRIEVESGWLNVTYKGTAEASVNVESFLQSNDTDQDIVFITVGNVLKITHTKKQGNYNWNSKNKGYINLSGPETMALDIKGTSGNINVDKISSDITSIKLSSGNVTVSNLTGDLSIKATSGNLTVTGVNGNVTSTVTSGNANFMQVSGNVDYESTSGSVDANGVSGEMNVSLTSGNAKLNNIGKLGVLQFTSGNIRATDAGLGENTRFSGTSGNFNVQTGSNLKAFNFSLKASSGNLKVGGTSTGKSLEMDNGATNWIRGAITSGNISIVN